jgi:Zn-dependent protease with chaperone function
MSVSTPRPAPRPHPRGLPIAIVSVLIGAAAIAGLLLGNSFGNDAPARTAGESGAGGLLLVLLLVAAGLGFAAGAIVGLRLQRRARPAPTGGARAQRAADARGAPPARLKAVAEMDSVAEAEPARDAEPTRKPGRPPARSQDKRRISAEPVDHSTVGSTPPPAR